MIKIGIFASLSILLLVFTLSRPHRHRFYRFIAFESLLALIILNVDSWFHDPFSPMHIVSWILLTASLLLAIHGFRLLRIAGSPKGDIEDTTRLITTGAYQYIRHPLYCSLLLLGVGVFLKRPTLLDSSLLIILLISVYATAKVEERDNIIKFGHEYQAYMEKTRMFIPFLF
ncbi:MAG: isoprenylcysteine carboxylmethyltransferase family protein [Anaerolineaceae bacterium]|nr:MAG: isoprenylcysteine carboxylmethyltransferase family protein [Anaerolineaceae bacterium]